MVKKVISLLVVMAIVLTMGMSVFATVGQKLTSPEAGWQRFDDTNTFICYTGTLAKVDSTIYYNGNTVSIAQNGIINFKFIGTKLRIIGGTYYDMGSNITVLIDGVSAGSYTSNGNQSSQTVRYEKLDLQNAEHTVIITAVNGRTELDAIDIDSTGILLNANVPDAPTALVALGGDSKVDLSWTATTGSAITYNIKRSITAGGPYTTITTTSAISYSDSTVTTGTTYYYVVSAVNSSGESANSNEVSATPNSSAVSLDVTSINKAKVGDEITANIVIKNAQNICAEDIKIVYDTTRLEYIGAENADGMKIYKEAALANGTQRYITACLGKTNAANGEKILFKLKFKAKAIGEAKIDIVNGRIADNATLEADVGQTNCGEKVVFIESAKDVNRTGEFTLLDLGIDAWYYGDAVTATDTTKYDADVVINNSIDDYDLIEIVNQMLSNSNYSPNV